MTDALRGAIIGFGNIAERGHWPAYASSRTATIEAVVEPAAARRDVAKALKPSLRFYESAEALLRAETLDFVDICSPPASHMALASTALSRGVDVLCEKPLCLSTEEYRSLAGAVRSSGRLLFTVHNWTHAPILARAFELLQLGCIGRVWHAEIFVLRNRACTGAPQGGDKQEWRTERASAGGGITIDHGWHAFYLLLNAMGQLPRELLARMEGPEGRLEDVSNILVQFPEGNGYLHLTWRADQRKNLISLQGSDGTILVDDHRLLITDTDGNQREETFPALSDGSHHPDWFGPLFETFLAERRDKAGRGNNFRAAGWCVAMTEAAYASQADGARFIPVRFPEPAALA